MPSNSELTIRRLSVRDGETVWRIATTSEYVYCRFDVRELSRILSALPAVGVFTAPHGPLGRVTGGTLQAFLVVNWLSPPSAWIGGFGVTQSEGQNFQAYLERALPALEREAASRGAQNLYYSGGDMGSDWLCPWFREQGFETVTMLRSYDKFDFQIPTPGAQDIRVRPFTPADIEGVVAVENLAFDQMWRHDAASFLDIARDYPYFVVAEDDTGIIGYQFNALDAGSGYLVRIAVHPRTQGNGVGARLMADAIAYFARSGVMRILLNTEESNTRAHRLYEWFGFERVEPAGFVLGRPIQIADAG
jgi:ribosomal-protein-alanine N-acetyltransferase